MPDSRNLDVTYILPIRQDQPDTSDDLAGYLAELGRLLEVIVVDGSPRAVFDLNQRRWRNVRHVAPLPALQTTNGKVGGVLTGLQLASHERVIIADDDVRYDEAAIDAIVGGLDAYDVVRPQNHFDPTPWHALWDSGRSLLNRLWGGDWPGTLALRRPALPAGYRGDVLFENLELVRTVEARGGHELLALDLFVPRRPPTLHQFLNQRLRQAYDEFARPGRLLFQLTWLPLQITLLRRPRLLAALYLAVIASAEAGRRRAVGYRVFPFAASLMAPLWVIERSLCSWLALASRLRFGGIRYRGTVLTTAASSLRELPGRVAMEEAEAV